MATKDPCLVPQCGEVPRCRGLCDYHYRYMNRLCRQGQAEEEDLIKRGLLLPKGRPSSVFRLGDTTLGLNPKARR